MPQLKVESMDKEQARINAMRARGEARRERCLNARVRTIGLDLDALDAQVKEKEAQRNAEKHADEHEVSRATYINRLIEQREMEEREAAKREIEVMKEDWRTQMSMPKNNAPKMGDPVHAEKCGLGAVQQFNGEDVSQYERMRMQQQQMRSWTRQQMEERKQKEIEEKQEEERYAAYLRMLAAKREELEGDEVLMARSSAAHVRDDNLALAEQARNHKAELARQEAEAKRVELEHQMHDPILCEDMSLGMNAEGRVRRDHFKGFTRDQTLEFYRQNEELIQMKRANHEEKEDQENWRNYQYRMEMVMNEAEMRHQAQMKEIDAQRLQYLQQQAHEEAQRRARSMKDKFGEINGGFFDGFGTSWR